MEHHFRTFPTKSLRSLNHYTVLWMKLMKLNLYIQRLSVDLQTEELCMNLSSCLLLTLLIRSSWDEGTFSVMTRGSTNSTKSSTSCWGKHLPCAGLTASLETAVQDKNQKDCSSLVSVLFMSYNNRTDKNISYKNIQRSAMPLNVRYCSKDYL